MRLKVVLPRLSAALSLLLPSLQAAPQDPGVEALFRRDCMGCHAAPDPAFPTDIAWLDQIRSTA